MNTADCRIVLRPRGPLETVDVTLLFIGAHFGVFGRLAGMVLLPLWVPMAVVCWAVEGHPAVLLLVLPVLDLVQVPFTLVGAKLLFGDVRPIDGVWGMLSWATVAFLALRWVQALLVLPTLGLGLLLAPTWHFAGETLLLERVGLRRGISRSGRLGGREPLHALAGVGGRWFLTVWTAMGVELSAQAVLSGGLQLGTPLGAVAAGEVTPFLLLGLLLAQPLHALFRLLLYIDARTLAEGWDIQAAFWNVVREER